MNKGLEEKEVLNTNFRRLKSRCFKEGKSVFIKNYILSFILEVNGDNLPEQQQ